MTQKEERATHTAEGRASQASRTAGVKVLNKDMPGMCEEQAGLGRGVLQCSEAERMGTVSWGCLMVTGRTLDALLGKMGCYWRVSGREVTQCVSC